MSRRERKSKGSLSVLDEFTSETGAGEITYSPPAPKEVLARIEKATKLADVPISMRLSDSSDGNSLVKTDNKQITKHKPKWRQTEDKTNLLKSENKQSTIGLQLDHKQTTEQSTIGLQLDHKQSTEDTLKNELVYKRSTEQTTDWSTIGLQLDHKQSTKWHISSLYGHER
ncbi:hypothetical protein K2X05_07820, partial [bacterium]|nr:hypothetical protein [bacterium]